MNEKKREKSFFQMKAFLFLTSQSNFCVREHPLMMSDFGTDGGSEMTQKNRTLEGKNRMLGGCGSKIVKNRRTSFVDDL